MIFNPQNIAIIGASGAIGNAFLKQLSSQYPNAAMHAFSRSCGHYIDYQCEDSIAAAAALAVKNQPLDIVIVAIGLLHNGNVMPEKSLKDITATNFQQIFAVNTIAPALIAKHFLPQLNKEIPAKFAALSARIGSISDNKLGGWYAYRASKAALNMIIKNAAIEVHRRNKQATIVTLHPGTVDSHLSKPFQAQISDAKLFTAEYAVQNLIAVLQQLKPEDSGKCFAWDGSEILP